MCNHYSSPSKKNINIRSIKCSFRINVEDKLIRSYGDMKFLIILFLHAVKPLLTSSSFSASLCSWSW